MTPDTPRVEPEVPAAPSVTPAPALRPEDLRAILRRPHHVLDLVLTEPGRLATTIAGGRLLGWVIGVLLGTSALLALPYGLVLDPERFWRVVLLYLGSFAICFPSLPVFSAYVGCRITPVQNLALGLIVSAVAAIFTFGFFPILWFLQATMRDDSALVTPYHVSVTLLSFSLLAGVGHLFRCFFGLRRRVASSAALLVGWLSLVIFITYRMALLLELA
jgi:hypothetical protein